MEQNNYKDVNNDLVDICSALFKNTGEIGYHNLEARLSESAQDFNNNFPPEEDEEYVQS